VVLSPPKLKLRGDHGDLSSLTSLSSSTFAVSNTALMEMCTAANAWMLYVRALARASLRLFHATLDTFGITRAQDRVNFIVGSSDPEACRDMRALLQRCWHNDDDNNDLLDTLTTRSTSNGCVTLEDAHETMYHFQKHVFVGRDSSLAAIARKTMNGSYH
jgi:hypothetical protein